MSHRFYLNVVLGTLFTLLMAAVLPAGSGTILKQRLLGPGIRGVVPEGQALADESDFQGGGSTVLTVWVRNVNLPDGTVRHVSLDFKPAGTITLRDGEGALTIDLGHFAVSYDQVRVVEGDRTALSGAYFR